MSHWTSGTFVTLRTEEEMKIALSCACYNDLGKINLYWTNSYCAVCFIFYIPDRPVIIVCQILLR